MPEELIWAHTTSGSYSTGIFLIGGTVMAWLVLVGLMIKDAPQQQPSVNLEKTKFTTYKS